LRGHADDVPAAWAMGGRVASRHPPEGAFSFKWQTGEDFTRFITARRPGEGQGRWRQYYQRWAQMTVECAGTASLELLPEPRDFVPPARVFDKPVYSPLLTGELHRSLQPTGGRCNRTHRQRRRGRYVCVGEAARSDDFGYRTILVEDAICSTSDEAYENILKLFTTRYSHHVEVVSAEEVLDFWR